MGKGRTAAELKAENPEYEERRGFRVMPPERQKEIASKGGRAAHKKGTAHEWTREAAREAGRKGGKVSRGGRGRLIVSTPEPEANPAPLNLEIIPK